MPIAIFGTSLKPGEKRIPLHPEHIAQLPDEQLQHLVFEEGYAKDFGFDINTIKDKIAGIMPREALFKACPIVILPKICDYDLPFLEEGQVVYGWPHCVQGEKITQAAIDKKITLVAFEAMFSGNGDYRHHIFHKNNEIAGFASVQHATQIRGITGYYGGSNRGIVFGFGSTARGAVYGLMAQGITDITVFTRRPSHLVQQQIPGVKYDQFTVKNKQAVLNGDLVLEHILQSADVIVNCMLQNPNDPVMIIDEANISSLKNNALVIDVSCDEKMGFHFAKPTSFDAPCFQINDTQAHYYGVDHTPSLYWNTSSYELSRALIPFLGAITTGKKGYQKESILTNALEIEEGCIVNPAILDFQTRNERYPHAKIAP